MIDFEKIKAVANSNENYLMKLLPNAQREGNELRCGTIYGDKGDSFSYNIKSGVWADFATGQTGASVLDLVAARENVSLKDAAEIISAELGGVDNMTVVTSTSKGKHDEKITSVPCRSGVLPTSITRNRARIEFSHVWAYKTSDGQVIACDARYDKEDGGKEVLPFLFNGNTWYAKALPNNRYLYNLDQIAKNDNRNIIVVEGCKTADAGSIYFPDYVVTTWQGGSNAVEKSDWSPLYNRHVIIIPDADEAGRKAAKNIAEILQKKASIVKIVDTRNMEKVKKGWDLADALADNMSQSDLIAFIKANIAEYTIKPSETSVVPEIVINQHQEKISYDDKFFRCLGVQGDKHFFYKRQTSQILDFSPNNYDSKHLVNLAPLSWWQVNYPSKTDANWIQAIDDLCRIQEKIGFFDNSKIRGRGAWFDDGRTVLNLGNCIYTNGRVVEVDDFDSDYFYEKASPLAVRLQTSLPASESSKFIGLCNMARWDRENYGSILAGWLFSALVCGAMPFRSHLYLVGAAGTGKSWMLENIVKPIMGNMALSVSSKSTEAGIRDQLGGDIRPVIFDEAEAEEKPDKIRMQAVFDLARNGSSEKADAIVKFGAKYICRSAFLFASINSSMSKTADLSRTAFIKLRNAPVRKTQALKELDHDNFRKLETFASQLLTPEYCNSFLSRALMMVPILRASHHVIADVAARVFGSRRLGDQMAMIIAGLHCLESDDIITEERAIELINKTAIASDKDEVDNQTQEERALDHLLFADVDTPAKYSHRKFLLNQLIALINGNEYLEGIDAADIKKDLASRGIIVGEYEGVNCAFFAIRKACLPSRIYDNTEWEYSWGDALRRIDDVKKTPNKFFSKTLVSQAIAVPLYLIIKESNPLLL